MNEQSDSQLIERGREIIQRLETQAEEYGELRMVQFFEQDAEVLRKVLELAWQYMESGK